MNLWINQVLISQENTKTSHRSIPFTQCILGHMMGSIVNCIQAVGIDVQHILAGCIYLYQPLDVEVNHPIKKIMMAQWDWMLEGDSIDAGGGKDTIKEVGR